jgi:2-polyprenyl-3-methyl-5-hydroxy-6-metoxy-1,4-benzoquinol methylase
MRRFLKHRKLFLQMNNRKIMENRFDIAAETWDEKPGRMEMASKFANEITEFTQGRNFKSAMEYGCGTGNVSFFLKDNFSKITLADSSIGMIGEVQQKIEKLGVAHFTPVKLDLENETVNEKFDVIYSLMTMHHVKNVEKLISEFGKIISTGGMLILGDLVKEDGNFHKYPENQDVHFGFEKEYLEQVLKENGLLLNDYKVFHELERDHTSTIYPLFVINAIKE